MCPSSRKDEHGDNRFDLLSFFRDEPLAEQLWMAYTHARNALSCCHKVFTSWAVCAMMSTTIDSAVLLSSFPHSSPSALSVTVTAVPCMSPVPATLTVATGGCLQSAVVC